MTWYDCKLATLQKMYSADGDTIPADEATRSYVAGMPSVANEALQLLLTCNKFKRRYISVVLNGDGQTVDLEETVPDFYAPGNGMECYIFEEGIPRTLEGVQLVAGKYLIFPKNVEGNVQWWYDAYPAEITAQTSDALLLALDPEVAVLLPLYMASQLYKEDDISMATIWRNEFEAARDGLRNRVGGVQGSFFTKTTGWL